MAGSKPINLCELIKTASGVELCAIADTFRRLSMRGRPAVEVAVAAALYYAHTQGHYEVYYEGLTITLDPDFLWKLMNGRLPKMEGGRRYVRP